MLRDRTGWASVAGALAAPLAGLVVDDLHLADVASLELLRWLAAAPALAGRPCEDAPLETAAVARGMALATRTAQALDASGAQVLLLARAGQDLSKYGLGWSHLVLAYRDGARWRVVHKLNQCGSDTAALYRQGLGEFFLDDLFEYAAGVAIPTPEVQAATIAWGKERAANWLSVLDKHYIGPDNAYLCGNDITIADYLGIGLVTLGEIIKCDFTPYPNVKRWMANMKKLPNWDKVNEVFNGFASSVKDVPFEAL